MPALDEITHAVTMSQRLYHCTWGRHEIFETRDLVVHVNALDYEASQRLAVRKSMKITVVPSAAKELTPTPKNPPLRSE